MTELACGARRAEGRNLQRIVRLGIVNPVGASANPAEAAEAAALGTRRDMRSVAIAANSRVRNS